MLSLDGVYSRNAVFYPVKPPTFQDLERLVQKIAERVSRYLEKAGYLVRDSESEYLDLYTDEEDAMSSIVGASISYRLAFGPRNGVGVKFTIRLRFWRTSPLLDGLPKVVAFSAS